MLKTLNLLDNAFEEIGKKALMSMLKCNLALVGLYIEFQKTENYEDYDGIIRNKKITLETNPTKKSNLIGNINGTYQVPSLETLGVFAVKRHLSDINIQQLKDQNQLSDELYDKLIQSPRNP